MAGHPSIARVEVGHYLIPLPQVLIDSTHGEMRGFEIVDGNAVAPERPGHGVEFDWNALEGRRRHQLERFAGPWNRRV